VEASAAPKAKAAASSFNAVKNQEAEFAGSVGEYPFYFLPYATPQFYDGRHANLPGCRKFQRFYRRECGALVEINRVRQQLCNRNKATLWRWPPAGKFVLRRCCRPEIGRRRNRRSRGTGA